jgi:dephospho-CoA kinase
MIVLGITGSIGMGKSVAAAQLRGLGIEVHDADRSVHRLLGRGGDGVASVARAFPGVEAGAAIDRSRLAARVFNDAGALDRLEAILHPLVRRQHGRFIAQAQRRRLPLVALDIPLLYETGGARECDVVAVVTCPAFLQEQRVLARPGMTRERLASIRKRQFPDAVKRRLADFVIPTGIGRRASLRRLMAVTDRLTGLRR